MAYQIQFLPAGEFRWKGEEEKWEEKAVTGRLRMRRREAKGHRQTWPEASILQIKESVHTGIPWRSDENADSASLGYNLRLSISYKFSGDVSAAGPQATLDAAREAEYKRWTELLAQRFCTLALHLNHLHGLFFCFLTTDAQAPPQIN